MTFDKKRPIDFLLCTKCDGVGFVGWRRCSECHGLGAAHSTRQHVLYWGYPLTVLHVTQARLRRGINIGRRFTVGILVVNFLLWAIIDMVRAGALWPVAAWNRIPQTSFLYFWIACGFVCYLAYRIIVERPSTQLVEHVNYSLRTRDSSNSEERFTTWPTFIQNFPRRRRLNIAATFTPETLAIIDEAYFQALHARHKEVSSEHLFAALLRFRSVGSIFIRLGIPPEAIRTALSNHWQEKHPQTLPRRQSPVVASEVYHVLFQSYEIAFGARQEYVGFTELFLAAIEQSPELQDLLEDYSVTEEKLYNVIEWARIREQLYRQYQEFKKAAHHRSTTGMDRAMTALATPFLNQLSEDLTVRAQFGRLETCVARNREIEDMFRVVEGGEHNVLLVGDHGVGKRTIIAGLAERMVRDDVPKRLGDKRLVRLSVSALLSGTTPAGAVERLTAVMRDIARARNIVLVIYNIHDLVGVSAGSGGASLDVAGTLAEFLTKGNFLTFATTTPAEYAKYIMNSPLASVFSKVDVREMEKNQATQALESKMGGLEYKQQVFFSYDAIEKAVNLATRFIHEMPLPGSALEIITEAASLARSKKGSDALVTAEEVAAVVADKTGIPVTTVTADESARLLQLEKTMHARVVGQDEAVSLVSSALRRARAEVRSTKRPIANFLFLGPTGVGKTELAKTIAEIYFGGEERMIRLDMSEYQDRTSVYRLIGTEHEQGSGLLTEAVRRNPFSLLLLDEIEKADTNVLNLFLQVMDDGRLTDSVGNVADFTNTILIATSNAGTAYVSEQLEAGVSIEAIKDRLLHGELKEYFKPEFLNRFDGIVLFKPLTPDNTKEIARILLARVTKDLAVKGIEFKIEEAALTWLSAIGFDPEFGARPLRRAIQEQVESKLADLLLSGAVRRKSTIILGARGEMRVS